MSTPVLWQFRASHFNEKARWAQEMYLMYRRHRGRSAEVSA